MAGSKTHHQEDVVVPVTNANLAGNLGLPESATGFIIFAHGSGSSRHSPRNRAVAETLQEAGLGTLLFDLLTAEEHEVDARTGELRFNIDLLTDRLNEAVDWTLTQPATRGLPIGLFGASTGAAAALGTAADRAGVVKAVVSRGGRPDLAGDALPKVKAPALLVVGARDEQVIGLNQQAADQLTAEHKVEIIPDAGHLFEEPGRLERVSELASAWFRKHLADNA